MWLMRLLDHQFQNLTECVDESHYTLPAQRFLLSGFNYPTRRNYLTDTISQC